MVEVIENWIVKRSGAHLTIEGTRSGQPVKLTGIVDIVSGNPNPVACDRFGNKYYLDAEELPF